MSPKRSPIRAASLEGGVRGRGVARVDAPSATGTSRYPRSTQSCWPSSSRRRARASQPPPRATSPLISSARPSQNAQRDGSLGVAPVQELVVRPRQQVDALGVPADQVGGGRQPLQILRLQRRLPVRGRELGVGVRPRLPAEGLPAPIEASAAVIHVPPTVDDARCAGPTQELDGTRSTPPVILPVIPPAATPCHRTVPARQHN